MSCWPTEEPRCRPCAALFRACKHKDMRRGCSVSKTKHGCSMLLYSAQIELREKEKINYHPYLFKWNQFLWGRGESPALDLRSKDTALPVFAFAAEKLMRPPNGKTTSVDQGGRDRWERTIHLDGRPVDRYTIDSGKLTRPHRLLKGTKGSSSPLVEEAVGKDRGGGCVLSKK